MISKINKDGKGQEYYNMEKYILKENIEMDLHGKVKFLIIKEREFSKLKMVKGKLKNFFIMES